jgi:GNAT superfamily N-acetyltransferase
MDRLLSHAVLKDGTKVEVRLVMPPEPGWADRMHCFLKHKGMPWQMHWLEAFAGRCDVLETRFFLLVTDGEPISNIMTAETAGIGIFGHVYTKPRWREKGAASILMRAVSEDFASRDGIALYLGTGYDTMPWRLYAKFGFEGIAPGLGLMRWVRQPERLVALFGGERLSVRPLRWGDWPLLQCLSLQAGGDYVKNMSLKRFGLSDMEGPLLTLMERMQKSGGIQAAVVTNGAGMVVGFGTATPLDASLTDYVLVDLFAHRAAAPALGLLVRGLELPADKPVLAVIDEASAQRKQALAEAGFSLVGKLPGALKAENCREDLVLMMRTAVVSSQ